MAFFELLLNRVSLEYSEVLNDELRDWGKALRIFFFFFHVSGYWFTHPALLDVQRGKPLDGDSFQRWETCESEWIGVMRRSLAVTNTISKWSTFQLSIQSATNKDAWDDKGRKCCGKFIIL